ncbi:ABC transporter substrate-binding protein [Sulfoacidibacillus ferrooxidans]|uniref:Sn-glycerol-3-phosphate-binding periplasmic protein UgpB n=1 Tax=Sulfoacidibacillus ferrooxidans TaxID=2005001 RepID=A0A9X2AAT1_9BACL|nr:ABC transporter substrate-binding protein [Sulfoacidibacillus ferrooxidans]MCI0182198.1 sn-glycerol-3-phosphate-binding periplasmic protein UgpB [Sulfoacidibacillus ferrooxidans]
MKSLHIGHVSKKVHITKRSFRTAGLLSGAFALLLTGCGTSTTATPQNQANPGATTSGTVNITFAEAMSSGKQASALTHLVNQFEQKNPSVTVTLMPEPSYGVLLTKEEAAIAAQNPPTIGQAYEDWAANFAQSQAILPLTSFVNGKNGLSAKAQGDFWPSVWSDQFLPDGKIWMMPFNKSDFVMYYNANQLKKMGQAVPTTWTQFAQVASAVTSQSKGTWAMSMDPGNPTAPGNGTYLWLSVLRSFGGHLYQNGKIAFDSPQGIQTMNYFNNLYKAGALKLGTNYPGQTALGAGRAAFDLSTVASYPYNVQAVNGKFTMDVAALPAGPSGQGNMMQGTNIVMFAKATPAQQQAAWKFMKWLTEPQQTAYWAKTTGYLPVRQSAEALMSSYYSTHPYQQIATQSLQYAKPTPPVAGMQQAVGYIGDAITEVLTQHVPASQALQAAAQKAQQALTSQGA